MSSSKIILITGAAGFIGINLTKKLLSLGYRVVGLDNFYSSRPENIRLFEDNPSYEFVRGDVRDFPKIGGSLDEIYNLACPASPVVYQKDPLFTLETSVFGTRNVLELAQGKGARVLHASTSEVYGDPRESPQEECYFGNVNPVGPRSCYDEGKRVAETFCYEYFQRGVDVRVVRIFNTYGPYMAPQDGRVITNFITQALSDEDLTVYGDGTQTRSFCFVSDLVEGLIKYMEHSPQFFGPLNFGNPREFAILELAEKVLELIPESESKLAFKPLPKDDPKRRKPDISKARNILNWEPQVGLDVGLEKTIDYVKSFEGLEE